MKVDDESYGHTKHHFCQFLRAAGAKHINFHFKKQFVKNMKVIEMLISLKDYF